MNTAEIEAQAYNITVAQGKAILSILAEIEKQLNDEGDNGAIDTAAILDLARAMSCIGGHAA